MTLMASARRRAPWWSVALWALVGATAGFGLAFAFTYGSYFLLATLILGPLALFITRRHGFLPWPAALIGLAVAPGYVAWLNRNGPGEVCRTASDGVTCIEQWNPWPIAAGALLLVLVGVALLVIPGRRSPIGT